MFFGDIEMFKQRVKNKNAQVMVSEYVLVLFIIMAAMASMTIYFRRAVQAKIWDARVAMVNMVAAQSQGYYKGRLQVEYEPYYTNTDKVVSQDAAETTRLIPTLWGEEYIKQFEEYTNVQTVSETAPPKDAAGPGHGIGRPVGRGVQENPSLQ